MPSRTRFAISTAVLAAAATALFIGTPGAGATQGQPVLAGAQNTETSELLITNTTRVSLNDCLNVDPSFSITLLACGFDGIEGF